MRAEDVGDDLEPRCTIETLDIGRGEINEDRIIRGMVGRAMADRYPKREPRIGGPALEVWQNGDWTLSWADWAAGSALA